MAGPGDTLQSLSSATPGCWQWTWGLSGRHNRRGTAMVRDVTESVPLHGFVSRTFQSQSVPMLPAAWHGAPQREQEDERGMLSESRAGQCVCPADVSFTRPVHL